MLGLKPQPIKLDQTPVRILMGTNHSHLAKRRKVRNGKGRFNKILNNQFYLLNKAKILQLVSVYRINSMCNPSMKMSLLFYSKAEFS